MAVKIFRKDMLVTTLVIVVAIFLIGFYFGDRLDKFKVDDATLLLETGNLDAESFEVEGKFLDLFSEQKCTLDRKRLFDLGKQLGKMGSLLTEYDTKRLTHKDSYNLLKRKYFITELKYYNLKKNLDDDCDFQGNIILFFYNIENNQDSLRQGEILDILVRNNEDLVVLSFDKDFDESVIKTLVEFYGIKTSPTIIINYEHKLEGFVSLDEIKNNINKES